MFIIVVMVVCLRPHSKQMQKDNKLNSKIWVLGLTFILEYQRLKAEPSALDPGECGQRHGKSDLKKQAATTSTPVLSALLRPSYPPP